MGIPVMNFQPETFAQANPVIPAYQAGQQMYFNDIRNQYAQPMAAQGLQQAILNNQVLNAKAQYAQPMAQQSLQGAQLNNQILGNTAKYAPLMSQSALATQASQRGLMGAQSGYYGAQAQDIYQGQIPLQQAQAAMSNAQIPYIPEISMGKYYQGLGKVMQYSPTTLLMHAQNNPMMQSLIANNPRLAANLTGVNTALLNGQNPSLNAMGINIYGPQAGQPGGIGSQQPPQQNQSMQQPQQPFSGGIPYSTQNQTQNMQSAYPQNQMISPSSQMSQNGIGASGVNTPFGAVNPLDVANLQAQAQNALISKNYTPQQSQQIVYDNSAQNMLNQLSPDMQSVSSYAGLGGLAKLKQEQIMSSMNLPTSPDYQKYINFSRVQAPLLVNEIRRAFGGQATDSEKETMDKLIQPTEWDKNPSLMVNQLQSLVNTLHSNSQAITQTKSQNLSQAATAQPLQVPGSASSSGQMIPMIAPDGRTTGKIPASQLNAALSKGYRVRS